MVQELRYIEFLERKKEKRGPWLLKAKGKGQLNWMPILTGCEGEDAMKMKIPLTRTRVLGRTRAFPRKTCDILALFEPIS